MAMVAQHGFIGGHHAVVGQMSNRAGCLHEFGRKARGTLSTPQSKARTKQTTTH